MSIRYGQAGDREILAALGASQRIGIADAPLIAYPQNTVSMYTEL